MFVICKVGDKRRLSSFPCKLTFMWVTPLIYKGYKEIISLRNVWTVDDDESSEFLHETFTKAWEREKFANK